MPKFLLIFVFLELDFSSLTPSIQESFKNAMASINSYASTPYSVPPLDDDFDKKCVVFKHPDPVPKSKGIIFFKESNCPPKALFLMCSKRFKPLDLTLFPEKPDLPKLPPGLVNSVPPSVTNRAPGMSVVAEPAAEAIGAAGNKSYGEIFIFIASVTRLIAFAKNAELLLLIYPLYFFIVESLDAVPKIKPNASHSLETEVRL